MHTYMYEMEKEKWKPFYLDFQRSTEMFFNNRIPRRDLKKNEWKGKSHILWFYRCISVLTEEKD